MCRRNPTSNYLNSLQYMAGKHRSVASISLFALLWGGFVQISFPCLPLSLSWIFEEHGTWKRFLEAGTHNSTCAGQQWRNPPLQAPVNWHCKPAIWNAHQQAIYLSTDHRLIYFFSSPSSFNRLKHKSLREGDLPNKRAFEFLGKVDLEEDGRNPSGPIISTCTN